MSTNQSSKQRKQTNEHFYVLLVAGNTQASKVKQYVGQLQIVDNQIILAML